MEKVKKGLKGRTEEVRGGKKKGTEEGRKKQLSKQA